MIKLPHFLAVLFLLAIVVSSSANAQETWFWQNPRPHGTHLRAVQTSNPNLIVAVGNRGTVMKSTNGGVQWMIQNSSVTANLNGLAFIDANTGIIVGDGGTVLRPDIRDRLLTRDNSELTTQCQCERDTSLGDHKAWAIQKFLQSHFCLVILVPVAEGS